MVPSFITKETIPHKSGVYTFYDQNDRILYVGKAIDLYNRVSSYFSGNLPNAKTVALVGLIRKCETILVNSEIEALILEANLIKKHLPPYNIRLTDDKDYLYIKVTNEKFPKIITARKKELTDALDYFGPFPSGSVIKSTLKKLRRVFPWCANPPATENDISPKGCFYYHLGLCPGACVGEIDAKEYRKIVRRFRDFMSGGAEKLINELEGEMAQLAKSQDFEKANDVKKIIGGIKYLTQPINGAQVYLEDPNFMENKNAQSLAQLKNDLNLPNLPERIECYDISNLGGEMAVGSLVVLTHGEVDKKWYRRFKIIKDGSPNDFAMMAEMLRRRLKHAEWPTPDLVLIDGGRGQVRAAEKEILQTNWKVPLFGLAKRMEWLYLPETEVIKLPKTSLSLRLLQKIRDEAHRFALTYHRSIRKKAFLNDV